MQLSAFRIVKERSLLINIKRKCPTLCGALTFDGGGERDRTDDPLLAKQVLSQLSYTPLKRSPGSPLCPEPQSGNGPGRI